MANEKKRNEPRKDSNGTFYKGAAYEMADLAGDDLAFVDGVFDDCAADDYQGHGLELEVYKFDYDGRYWNGPYFYWSELYRTDQERDNIKARDSQREIYCALYSNFWLEVFSSLRLKR